MLQQRRTLLLKKTLQKTLGTSRQLPGEPAQHHARGFHGQLPFEVCGFGPYYSKP